jgi:phenylacetate-CoA ligase
MPLIRYCTNDLSRFIPGECACSPALARLETIRSRLDGVVRLGPRREESSPGLTLCMADLDEALFPIAGLMNFRAGIVRQPDNDRLLVWASFLPGRLDHAGEAVRAALKSIPVLEQGAPQLDVKISVFDPRQAGSLAKRKIQVL